MGYSAQYGLGVISISPIDIEYIVDVKNLDNSDHRREIALAPKDPSEVDLAKIS
ncbi:MAG: hypothetical protein Q7R52_04700 [archaeon]|nr:hypothetical protein [archaeon]